MKLARRASSFLWDFVVGEDWRLATTTAAALGGGAVWVALGVNAWWWVPAALGAGLWITVRR